jgi:APA family basic amino acid/polyamine antiporter
MATVPGVAEPAKTPRGALLRILGVSFSVAVTLGSTIGIGILRTPGTVAAQLGNAWLVMAIWTVGGIYALFGALAVAELAATMPQAGGWYVYAHRALGEYAGFTIGWINWISFCTAVASITIVIGEYAGRLVPAYSGHATAIAIAVLLFFTLMHWLGLRLGSRAQELLSFATALAFVPLIVVCLVFGRATASASVGATGVVVPQTVAAIFLALTVSFQSVIFTYDGWYGAVYFSEENTDPARNLPRSMLGAVVAIVALYLLVNLALLRVLPLSQLAQSPLAAADAAQLMFGVAGGEIITALSLLSSLSVTNAGFMQTPRILYGMSRDGLFLPGVARVNHRGTPVVALIVGTVTELLLVASGTFERLLAVTAFFFVLMYGSGFISLLVLRAREPGLPRPFLAWGYPWTTLVVVVLSCIFLVGVIINDTANSIYALTVVAISYPAYLFVKSLN